MKLFVHCSNKEPFDIGRRTLDYKGYTIKAFRIAGKDCIKIFLGEELIDYSGQPDERYEGSVNEKEGIEAAKQFIDELEEKENSL